MPQQPYHTVLRRPKSIIEQPFYDVKANIEADRGRISTRDGGLKHPYGAATNGGFCDEASPYREKPPKEKALLTIVPRTVYLKLDNIRSKHGVAALTKAC